MGFLRPIALRDPRQGHRAATWLELCFDLCFVVAVSSLARTLHDDPTIGGLLRFGAVFVPIWWAWMGYTWFATAWDNDDTLYRILWFGAMLAILWLAAAIGDLVTGDPVPFVLAYVTLRGLLAVQFLRVFRARPTGATPFIRRYLIGNVAGVAIWLLSLAVPGPIQPAIWALGLLVEVATPIWAVASYRGQPYVPRIFHPGHIRERYGLFALIVLGESILAVAVGTADIDWQAAGVVTGVLGFALAAAIWWTYFGRVDADALELGATEAFQWGYGHLFVYAGIAAVGVGIELAILAAAEAGVEAASAGAVAIASSSSAMQPEMVLAASTTSLDVGARLVLGVGIATFLSAVAFLRWSTHHRMADPIVLGRLAAAVACLVVAALPVTPAVTIAVTFLIVISTILLEARSADAPAA